MDVWRDTWPLRKNRHVGVEQVTFGVLWELCGGRPGRIAVTARLLGEHFVRDAATLRVHLEKLARVGVIAAVARDKKSGTFLVDVYHPCPEMADARPDPQRTFWESGFDELAAALQNTTKPGGDTISSTRDAEGATRGNFPVGAGTFPRESSRGKVPAIPGRENFPEKQAQTPRGKVPAGKFPRPFNDNEKKQETSNGTTKPNDKDNDFIPAARESSRGKVPADRRAEALDALIHSRRAAIAANDEAAAATARTVDAGLVADVVTTHYSPAAQKQRLVETLRRLVRDPATGAWLFGVAADLAIVHGQGTRDDAGTIFARMDALMANMRAHREQEARTGKPARPLGKWLNKEVLAICRDHGIAISKRRAQREEVLT